MPYERKAGLMRRNDRSRGPDFDIWVSREALANIERHMMQDGVNIGVWRMERPTKGGFEWGLTIDPPRERREPSRDAAPSAPPPEPAPPKTPLPAQPTFETDDIPF